METGHAYAYAYAYIDGEGGDDHEGDFPGCREADDEPYG
jgi:hypothetical protein